MIRRAWCVVPVMACVLAMGSAVVLAAQESGIERELDHAKVLYRDGRLDEAVAALRTVISQLNQLRDFQNRKTQLADAHLHLGLSYFALRDESAALENFRQVAALDPERTVDPNIYSPRVVSLFERARSEVGAARGEPPAARPTDPHASLTDRKEASPPKREDELPLLPGTRVRLQLRESGAYVKGNLIASGEGVFSVVDADNHTLSYPRDMVSRVEVLKGRKGHWIMGAIIGVSFGAIYGAFETPGCGGNDGDCYTRGENIGYGAGGFGIVGALVGALYRTDQWAEVPMPAVRLTTTANGGRQLAVSFRIHVF